MDNGVMAVTCRDKARCQYCNIWIENPGEKISEKDSNKTKMSDHFYYCEGLRAIADVMNRDLEINTWSRRFSE